MISRRKFLGSLATAGAFGGAAFPGSARIDRAALVRRHNPVARAFDPLAPLSVGNGEFAFTADVTGLQTFPQLYENAMPLCSMAQWGWHSKPLPPELAGQKLVLTDYDTHGRSVGYQTKSEGQTALFNWLRENPHRLHLGRIGLRLSDKQGSPATPADINEIEQRLDLSAGVLTSRFRFDGEPVTVKTAVHPQLDLLAVSIVSPLLADGRLSARLAFPYGSPGMAAADWTQNERHRTELSQKDSRADFRRKFETDEYFCALAWQTPAGFRQTAAHEFHLAPQDKTSRLEFVAAFAPRPLGNSLPTPDAVFAASAEHWRRFWSTGGAIELDGSRDARAVELERRIVLSQYLTAINCAGTQPPAETGLVCNSWYGKFHLEMHWWHAAHFALWGRLSLLEKSLGWYEKILPMARSLAQSQGYAGARWPKMVGPEGRDSPSPIGPLLIWQQPHPIFYAELCYQTRPMRQTLARFRRIVQESAEFMASFAHWDGRRYTLGPPLIPAQENHPARETWNPTFELAYWAWGLRVANDWRARSGLARVPQWDEIAAKLAPLPVKEGVYLAHENCPHTYTERNRDHPSMLAALGVLNGAGVDRETMRRTLKKVMREWQWPDTWGWDYPMTAMTAARLGETETALDALLLDTPKNRYLPNGHNYQRANLPCYLPGNGGLLYAVALMAGGWQNAPDRHAPGFPSDGWNVRVEGFPARLLKQT
jgi:hypothetical protein